jgi:large subunit ribosomal protein L30
MNVAYAIVRVRGHSKIKGDIEDTMKLMHLNRPNHCVVLPENETVRGMLYKTKDYVTWGEVDETTLAKMIKARARMEGDAPVDDESVKAVTKYTSIIALARAVDKGEVALTSLDGIKPLFRLSPPRKGYEGNKRSYQNGGALGYRGKDINKLIERML